ncbi:hypothetical protein [Maribacter sp. 2304DJ31-5]|uniref:hypothetical protein n=1 Tax=Maribacter sp. 2304DJ31-5 TaxID=3386273 RepID=UPI0039BD897C
MVVFVMWICAVYKSIHFFSERIAKYYAITANVPESLRTTKAWDIISSMMVVYLIFSTGQSLIGNFGIVEKRDM